MGSRSIKQRRVEDTCLCVLSWPFGCCECVIRMGSVNQADWRGWTPLHIACKNGHLNVVNALLTTNGIGINQGDSMDGHHCIFVLGGPFASCECNVKY